MRRLLAALLMLGSCAWATELYQCAIVQASFPTGCTLLIPKGTRALPCSMHIATVAPRAVDLKVLASMTEVEDSGQVTYDNSVDVATLLSKSVSGAADEVVQPTIPMQNVRNCRELHIHAKLTIPGSDYVLGQGDLACRIIASANAIGPPLGKATGDDLTVSNPPTIKAGTTDLVEGLPSFDISWHTNGTLPGYLMFKLDGGPQMTPDNLQMAKGAPIIEIPTPPGGGRLHVDVKEMMGAGSGWTEPMVLSAAVLALDGNAIVPEKVLYHIDPHPTQ